MLENASFSFFQLPCHSRTPFPHPIKFPISCSCSSNRPLKIDPHNPTPHIPTLSDQVAKVLPRDLTLLSHANSLAPLLLQVLDITLQAFAETIGRVLERATDLSADALRVGVRVVKLGELGGEFGAEAAGEGVWDLGEGVGCGEGNWR